MFPIAQGSFRISHLYAHGIVYDTQVCFHVQASPSPAGSMFFFYTNYLGFSPEFVGRIQLLDGVAQLLGEQLTT